MTAAHAAQALVDFDTLAGAGERWCAAVPRHRHRPAPGGPPTEFKVAPTSRPSRRSSSTCTWRPGLSGTPGPLLGTRAGDAQPPLAAGGAAEAYNAKLLDGKPRQFPTRRLAGADAVLARIYHEHTVSKAYTPLMLGEILAARTWTSADELNKLAAADRDSSRGGRGEEGLGAPRRDGIHRRA